MATRQVSFASDIGFNASSTGGHLKPGNVTPALICHLGGLCIRDYQSALQQAVNELKSREQQVNQLYSCLLDREETIARLSRQVESMKAEMAGLKQRLEQAAHNSSTSSSTLLPPVALPAVGGRRGTLILTHGIAGELHQTAAMQQSSGDSSALLIKPRRDRLRAALAKNDLLGRLDVEQADGLISQMTEQRVPPGDVIIREGESGTRVYVMEDGEVDIHREGQFLCRLLAPMVFGELAVIYNAPRSATVTAATHCRLWQIESKAFHKCMTRIRQRTINKIATDLKNISIFSTLSKSMLSSILDAGEELHFSQGSHVSIAAGTLYIVTAGSLSSQSLVCSCGNKDGHRNEPALSTCSRQKTEIKATACFCTQLPENVTAALSAATLPSSSISDIYSLPPEEVATLKASENNFTRVTCYRLDTNFVLRALEKRGQEQQVLPSLPLAESRSANSNQSNSTRDQSLPPADNNKGPGDPAVGIANLSIIALLPSRDSFSHLFCVVDTRSSNTRRNAVIQEKNNDGDEGATSGSLRSNRRAGCYVMRWVIRQKADAAGMGERLCHERQHLLACSSCDFIVQLIATMQDQVSVYFVYEACLGGTLESLMKNHVNSGSGTGSSNASTPTSTFSLLVSMRKSTRNAQSGQSGRGGIDEEWARFYLATVVEALDFLHSNGIVHRNICPACIWITSSGYGKLGDFTYTKSIAGRSRTFSLCGPVERLAPEVMLNKGHGLAADRWSVGTLLFEMITGKPPFLRDDPMMTCSAILQHASSTPGSSTSSSSGDAGESLDFPRRVSKQARDAVRRLCRPCPADRITFDDLRQHAFFTQHNNVFDWQAFRGMQMPPPFVPTIVNAVDVSNIPGARKVVGTISVSSLVSTNDTTSISDNAVSDQPSPLFPGFDTKVQENYTSSASRSGVANWSKDF